MIITERKARVKASDYWGGAVINKIRTCEVESPLEAMTDEIHENNKYVWASHARRNVSPSWANIPGTTQSVIDRIMAADPVFYKQVQEKMSELKVQLCRPDSSHYKHKVRRRKRIKSDFGNEVDIHAVRQGKMDRAWTNTKKVEREGNDTKLVHLVLNTILSGGLDARNVNYRTALMMLVHDDLVRLGKSVAVSLAWKTNCTFTIDNNNIVNVMYVPIKSSSTYLSPEHFAAYSSAAFARLVMMYRMHSMTQWKATGSYGHCINNFEILPKPLADAKKRGAHIVNVGACFNKSQAIVQYDNIMNEVQNIDAKTQDLKVDRRTFG